MGRGSSGGVGEQAMATAGSRGAGHEDERAKCYCRETREPAICLLLLEGTVESSRPRAEGASPEQVYNGTDSDLQPSDGGDKFLLFLSHPVYGTLL